MFLLDTNIVSEMRRTRPHGAVQAWLAACPDGTLFISAMTVFEIRAGIERTRERDPTKADELTYWLDRVLAGYQVLSVDAAVARVWARFMHRRSLDLSADAVIAATADRHGLEVATRNQRDFALFGVRTVDPFTFGTNPP